MEWNKEKLATRGLAVLIAYAVVRSLFQAASRPFWFDELCTLAVAQQPSLSAVRNALQHAADSHPPPFYLVERVAGAIAVNEHIAFRLPSVFAFCCVVVCVFMFVRKRSCGAYALLCAAVPLMSILYDPYAVEARGYILATACVAIALVCYQNADALRWALFMGLSLAAAAVFHYYAVFAVVPFAFAEVALTWKIRRLRWSVWIALVCALVPLIVFRSLLSNLKQYYGAHYWAQPTLGGVASAYGSFFHLSASLGVAIASVAALGVLEAMWPRSSSERLFVRALDASFHERLLVLGLLALPSVFFLAMKVVHGGLLDRYMLPTVLGFSLAAGFILPRFDFRVAILFGTLLFFGLATQEASFWLLHRRHLGKVVSPATSIEELVNAAGHPDLPVVVSHGHDYFQLVHYASPERASRFVSLVDAPASMSYAGSDFVDKSLLALRSYAPLQVHEFQGFAAKHPDFLLYSSGGEIWDWWPARLLDDGYTLRLVAINENERVYLVSSKEGIR